MLSSIAKSKKGFLVTRCQFCGSRLLFLRYEILALGDVVASAFRPWVWRLPSLGSASPRGSVSGNVNGCRPGKTGRVRLSSDVCPEFGVSTVRNAAGPCGPIGRGQSHWWAVQSPDKEAGGEHKVQLSATSSQCRVVVIFSSPNAAHFNAGRAIATREGSCNRYVT
jgi:hypothetical protein